MFYKVLAHTCPMFDDKGNEIARSDRKYHPITMTVYSKKKSEVLKKAGQNLSAQEYSHNGLSII